MGTDIDVTADALSQAVGTLFDIRQAGIDWISVARALLAFREEERQRELDQQDGPLTRPGDVGEPDAVRREAQAGGDAGVLYIELQSAMLRSLLRVSRDWQRLLQDSAPALKRAADEYEANPEPSQAITAALVDQVVVFTQIVGEFMRDQGTQLERELLQLQGDVLGRHRRRPVAGQVPDDRDRMPLSRSARRLKR